MKKVKGKVVFIILCTIVFLGIAIGLDKPIYADEIVGKSDSRFKYTINSDKTSIIITKYVGTDAEVVIPNVIDGYRVIKIGSYAFNGCGSLVSIVIPEGVTSIASSAFEKCSSLTSIVIPNGVTRIGSRAFSECSSLSSIEIPNGVTRIEGSAFYKCSSLTSIKIPNGVTSIEDSMFANCSSLSSIEIPNGVTNIGNTAFYKCTSLTSIKIPSGVTNIGGWAFCECTSLNDINIPDGVTSIGDLLFRNCNSLSNIRIPSGVTSIGDWAFRGCSSLASIEVSENNAKYKSIEGVLYTKDETEIICYPVKKEGNEYVIRKSVTKIGDDAFYGCSTLTYIEIPKGVTSIGDSAFSNCTSLSSIEIPKGVTSIGDWAFYECIRLKSINIPDGVTSIGNSTFSNCSDLSYIEIPSKVTNIEGSAFAHSWGLSRIIIPDSVLNIGEYTFDGCYNLIIKCRTDSAAYKYAHTNNIACELDDIEPILTVDYSAVEPTNQDVVVTIKSNEEIQGVSGWTLSEDRMNMTKEYKENITESIIFKDLVGNKVSVQIKIENIDKTGPVLEVAYSTKELTNQNVDVTIESNEEMQEVIGWTLSSDKKSLSKTYTENGSETVTVKDLLGNSSSIQVKVENIDRVAPILEVEYSTTELTNKGVVVTIKANEEMQELSGWTLSSDKKSLSKTYTENASETITVKDLAGNSSNVQVKVENIDKVAPTATVQYSTTALTNKDVTVTLKSNEQVQTLNGWKLSNDKKSLSKTYVANVSESVAVKDLAGNEATVKVIINNIDKVAPMIEGIENGGIYSSIKPNITDENLEKIVLIKDGQEVEYTNGNTIKTKGKYELCVTDKAGNTTKVSFEIVEKANITSNSYTIDEGDRYILGIKIGETKEEIKNNLKSNMEYTIMTKEGTEVTSEKIGTGMKIKFETGETYEIVVTGDINGDGKISTTDITKMKKHIIQRETLQGCYEKAADVNGNEKITVTDLAKMKKVLVGLVELVEL